MSNPFKESMEKSSNRLKSLPMDVESSLRKMTIKLNMHSSKSTILSEDNEKKVLFDFSNDDE